MTAAATESVHAGLVPAISTPGLVARVALRGDSEPAIDSPSMIAGWIGRAAIRSNTLRAACVSGVVIGSETEFPR